MEILTNKIDTVFLTNTIASIKDSIETHKIVIEQIQSNGSSNNFELIGVLSGAIAAIAALIAIFLTYRNNRLERNSKRPYFTLLAPGFKQLQNILRLQITFINNGLHPAKNFKGAIRIFQEDLSNEARVDIDIVNDIPSNIPTPYYNDSIGLGANMPTHFIYCIISYLDPILQKEYNQEFFMKWNGVQNGTMHPDFVHVNTDEKAVIAEYIKNSA